MGSTYICLLCVYIEFQNFPFPPLRSSLNDRGRGTGCCPLCYDHLLQTSVRSPTNTFLTAVAGTAARPRIVPDMPTFKAPRLRRTTQSLKPLRSLSPTSAIRGKCHHANFKMRKPTLSAHAAGRHSTAVDHAAQLPAQRGPWKAHGSHAQHSSQLHAARQHGLGPLVVSSVRPLPWANAFEFAHRVFGAAGGMHRSQWPR